MKPQLTIVDAFADAPFRGNPAAVCLLAEMRETAWLHDLARELDFPATAFVAPDGGGDETGHYSVAVVHGGQGARPLRTRHAG